MSEQLLAMTPEQKQQFDEDGFILLEDALSADEVETLLNVTDEFDTHYRRERNLAADAAFQLRNCVAMHPLYRGMIDHPKLLPYVVDAIGYNIQIRTSHVDIRPPMSPEHAKIELGSRQGFFPWHSDGPNFGWPRVNGQIPFMEVKIGYYLTDLSEHNSGAICVVRGSHKESPWIGTNGSQKVDESRIVEVNVKSGTAMLWRTALLHCVTPNLASHARKCLYYGYGHRWIRPSDYDHQDASVLADCTPIQLQLLGELGTGKANYNGDDPVVHPVSRYWRPRDEDIPLKAWAEAQANQLAAV
ncbi:MAG: phytanoyl-CoA dioxygenase family protein [Chloroflexota bacterium]